MSKTTLLLSAGVLGSLLTIAAANDTIVPKHSIECVGGWCSLSEDGRWLAHQSSEDNRAVRLFDVNEHPAAEFVPQGRLGRGMIYGLERWFIDYVSPERFDSKWPGHRIWDLHARTGTPTLVLPQGCDLIRVNEAGTHLAASWKDADGSWRLRLWDLRRPGIRGEDFRELGAVTGQVFYEKFRFASNRGIIAVGPNGLMRWDIDAPDKNAEVLELGNQVTQVWPAQAYWLDSSSKSTEPSWVYWNGADGKTFITDFPSGPEKVRNWQVPGSVVTCDGEYLVERRGKECWLTRINGESINSVRLAESADGHYDTVMRFGSGEYLLVNMEKSALLPGDHVTEIMTWVFSLRHPDTPPAIMDERKMPPGGPNLNEFCCTYVPPQSGRWLIGWSKSKQVLWDISQPLRPESSSALSGIQGTIVHHAFADDRWLVLIGNDGRMYHVDLQANGIPKAIEFFRLEGPSPEYARLGAAKQRVFVSSADTVHVWNVTDFERHSSTD